ncbi:MAG: pyruvate, phosphate dikinase [Planctomycetes bacterium]|nr:pyruvate, phosphate dikinase [Planctomycetota bacterium]
MTDPAPRTEALLSFLKERAKELNCLYRIEELLSQREPDLGEVCRGVVEAIPPGWQYPDICVACIELDGRTCRSRDFEPTPWVQTADIRVQDRNVGTLAVYYTKEMPPADHGPFLQEEAKLLETIANRLGHFMMYNRMKDVFQEYRAAQQDLKEHQAEDWRAALNLLRQTDHNLFLKLSRRMLNLLCWSGIQEAEDLLQKATSDLRSREDRAMADDNLPYQKSALTFNDELAETVFALAARQFASEHVLAHVHRWLQEERVSFILQLLNQNLPLAKVVDSIRRYHHMAAGGMTLPQTTSRGVLVSLVRRFLSGQPDYLAAAVGCVRVRDFYEILDHIIYTADSIGKLGGKSAGLFLAQHVVRKSKDAAHQIGDIRVPNTWYIASDGLLSFLSQNNLTEVIEQKYKDLNQIRLEYPHLVQSFKNASFPTEIVQGLSIALDDLGDRPLIVRSSSLLEDAVGASFSGKYRSLFLANQGTKPERLTALLDAIADVYASVFSADPIAYRAERGLLDFGEEMGVMIQEVVGTRVGDYFLPSFAGVAFSRNDFRWSPRIRVEDGLLRLVPGLGTRAVDRLSDDYPILAAPGAPDLRVNVTLEEQLRYAPKKVDLINLKTNRFETVELTDLLRRHGSEIPAVEQLVSVFDGSRLQRAPRLGIDFARDDLVATFDGLLTDTAFTRRIRALLGLLEQRLRTPVDIEFAHDGKDLYLLQCRPQSYGDGSAPAHIPRDVPQERILFTASRHVSNGAVPDISHIVYVDPAGYDRLATQASLLAVARAVGKLNKLLPRRRFVLMGPGRWGSRGDIKLGVKVTYADISNTAVLIEIARKKGEYVPDLSFGTHFFQDLVEARIRYLPLYPDSEGTVFNTQFLDTAPNILADLLPEFQSLAGTVRLIDVPQSTSGLVLRVLMNADLEQAVGILTEPAAEMLTAAPATPAAPEESGNHWAWRLQMAERIASQLDAARFGVEAFYVFGSTKNATAGPASDIDILLHFRGTDAQRQELETWLDGWSLALEEMNHARTGYRTKGLLDVHLVTDADIARRSSFAVKIGAVTDPARPLPLGKPAPPRPEDPAA